MSMKEQLIDEVLIDARRRELVQATPRGRDNGSTWPSCGGGSWRRLVDAAVAWPWIGRRCHRRGAGRTPPASSNSLRIDDPFLPSRRAIDRVSSPAFRRAHTSAISASVNLLDTAHLPTSTP